MQGLKLLHGGDYNPEQWLDRPDILAQDIELMKKSPRQHGDAGRVFVVGAGAAGGCVHAGLAGGHHPQPIRQRHPHDFGNPQRSTPGLVGAQVPRGAPCAR